MSKHTKGRWYAVGAWVEHEDDNVADICTCNPADIGQERFGRSSAEIAANATLIAAAPSMLAALKKIKRLYPASTDAYQIAKQAIKGL